MIITCRKAALLISHSQEEPLSFVAFFSLKIHLLICSSCRKFRSFVGELTNYFADFFSEEGLDVVGDESEVKLRIWQKIVAKQTLQN